MRIAFTDLLGYWKQITLPFFLIALIITTACKDSLSYHSTVTTDVSTQDFNQPLAHKSDVTNQFQGSTHFVNAPDLDLFRLTRQLVPGSRPISQTIDNNPVQRSIGLMDTFYLVDVANNSVYQSIFKLALVTPHAYWYFEDGLDYDVSEIESAAKSFEEVIYPAITEVFGTEWNPGIDNDPHITVLNANLNRIAGYFSSSDEYPSSVSPISNQREIIYINAKRIPPGSPGYDQVLAHELAHAIHWNADDSEDTWVNEGLAELATSIALGNQFSIQAFLRGGPSSLINWPESPESTIKSYGATSLFMHFLTEHFGGRDDLKSLIEEPSDSISGIDAYLGHLGYEERFEDVFRLWGSANIVDDDGILGYDDMNIEASVPRTIRESGEIKSTIPQYSIEYIELDSLDTPVRISFNGASVTRLLPTNVGPVGCWWSNSGDSIDSTLTSDVVLNLGFEATLEYEVWFETEKNWDYIYVEVSSDGGETWQIIQTSMSSSDNPVGKSFGPGYTGKSNGWIKESINLSSFASNDLAIRLQYVTDDAFNASGGCFRNLSITNTNISDSPDDWIAEGFIFIDNVVRQEFQVQLIVIADEPTVHNMSLSGTNDGEIHLNPTQETERLIVAVGALAKKTRQPASYSLKVEPAG